MKRGDSFPSPVAVAFEGLDEKLGGPLGTKARVRRIQIPTGARFEYSSHQRVHREAYNQNGRREWFAIRSIGYWGRRI